MRNIYLMEIMFGFFKTNELKKSFVILSAILLPSWGALEFDIRDYCKISEKHNMCRWPNITEFGPCKLMFPSLILRMNIVKKMNELRANVATFGFPPQPPAADMRRIFYKDELQYIAERWAIHCDQVTEREFTKDRRMTGDRQSVGVVNVESYSRDIYELIDIAFSEGRYFPPDSIDSYVESPLRGIRTIFSGSIDYTRYVQLLWSRTEFVGCAILDRGLSQPRRYRFLCYMQQSSTPGQYLYRVGVPASKCPKFYGPDDLFKGLCSPTFLRDSKSMGSDKSSGEKPSTGGERSSTSGPRSTDINVAAYLTFFAMTVVQLYAITL